MDRCSFEVFKFGTVPTPPFRVSKWPRWHAVAKGLESRNPCMSFGLYRFLTSSGASHEGLGGQQSTVGYRHCWDFLYSLEDSHPRSEELLRDVYNLPCFTTRLQSHLHPSGR